jgi:WD40 repeat protein/mono/diheme cytochrome c family protein
MFRRYFFIVPGLVVLLTLPVLGADDVSFMKQVQPILNQSCIACHKPEKKKGKLDLTTYASLMAGGSEGKTVVPGKPGESALIEQIIPHGKEPPAMPEKGEKLSDASVGVLRRWVEQGAKNDGGPSEIVQPGFAQPGPPVPTEPVHYRSAPVITALALSPDGKTLAVAGRGEVLLVSTEGEPKVQAHLLLGSPRINSLVFASGGTELIAAGGAAGQFGHLQAWDVSSHAVRANWKVSGDTLFGLSVSSDGVKAAVGCADRTFRLISLGDGKELLNLPAHTDWVFGTALSGDAMTLVTSSRDKAVKRIGMDLSGSPVIIDIAEPELPGTCVARNPAGDIAAVGSADGATRIYRVLDLKPRTEKEKDPNRVRETEKVNGPANAIVFSPDGQRFAVAGTGEVKVFSRDGNRIANLGGHDGPVYGIAFSPDGERVYTAGYDAKVRVSEVKDGKLLREFTPF